MAFKILKGEVELLGQRLNYIFEDQSFAFLNGYFQDLGQVKTAPAVEEAAALPASAKVSRPGFKFNLSRLTRQRFVALLFLSGFLLALFSSLFYILPRAKVILTVESEPLVKTIDVEASPVAQSINLNPPVIPALEIEANVRKTESSPSGGKKDVGEKASGTATFYNKTITAVSFSSGTLISKGRAAGDDLRYLTKGAVVAPARIVDATAVSGYVPGTVTAEVAAETFGDEYNLPAQTTFSVVGKSTADFVAENSENFSGGTRKQITVVTAEDQRRLLENATGALKDELKQALLSKLVDGQRVDEESINFETVNKNFDKAVGEEADAVRLTLEMKARVLVYSQNDLNNLIASLMGSFVPDGYELFGADQTTEAVAIKASGRNLNIVAKGKGFIVPKINQEELLGQLSGRREVVARQFLSSLERISDYSLVVWPRFGPVTFLPLRPESFNIEVVRK